MNYITAIDRALSTTPLRVNFVCVQFNVNEYGYINLISDTYKLIHCASYTKSYDSLNNIGTTFTSTNKTVLKYLSFLMYTHWMPCLARFGFKGKSFRIRNFAGNNKLTLNFGYSHWTRLLFIKYWQFFKLKRQSYVAYTANFHDYQRFLLEFPVIRRMNHYNLRGLRLKRQALTRRFGKLSQHISSLH